jgi:hypothetical protein
VSASVLLVLAMVVFPVGFMMAGFDVSKEALSVSTSVTTQGPVDWDLVWPPSALTWEGIWRWLLDFGAAVQFTLSIVSFQRDRFYVPTDGWGRAWLMLAFFALTGQLALVLFALRRRF